MKHYNINEEILINQFVQRIQPFEVLEDWFNTNDWDEKREIISNLLNMVIQAHPTYEEITEVAENLRKP